MNELFLKILTLSISASWLILAVLLLRLILKKAPRWIHVALWGIVAFRLICPFTIESPFSLIPDSVSNGELVSGWADDYIGEVSMIHENSIDYDAAVSAGRLPVADGNGGHYVVTGSDRFSEPSTVESTLIPLMTVFWMLGMTLLASYTLLSYLHLRRKISTAIPLRNQIYQSEQVHSPFVLGTLRPKIYLPFDMKESNLNHVIAHEQAHIRRKDHWWKPLGFLLLIIHCFNPLMWLAYVLLCRDIELACDEKVIRELDDRQRADYMQALLSCSISSHGIAACPLAFGEVGVKERVKSLTNYQKPAFWIIAVSVLACVIAAVCFLTNPVQDPHSAPEPFGHSYRVDGILYSAPQYSFTYTTDTAPEYLLTADYEMFVSGDLFDDTDTAGWILQNSIFEEISLSSANFDDCFQKIDDISGWNNPDYDAKKIRKNTKQAWRIDIEGTDPHAFYYLIRTKSGNIYLTYGYDNNSADEANMLIRWLFQLSSTDLLHCHVTSEASDSYIEPVYYPKGFDQNEEYLPVAAIDHADALTFTADWDTETLTVTEEYTGSYGGGSSITEKENYTLTKNEHGEFELELPVRDDHQLGEAVYYIQAQTGVYVMKIFYGVGAMEYWNERDLKQYQTAYIGDAPNVVHTAQLLPYPEDYRYASIEIQSDTEPYELFVYLDGEANAAQEDFENCAATAFIQIGNMDLIHFCDAGSKEVIASFSRTDHERYDPFYLTVGSENVKSIEYSLPDSGGGVTNADGSLFRQGERILLEFLDGRTDLRGLDISAADENGKILWSISFPNTEDSNGNNYFSQDGWTITNIY